jgi:hypothetical protein
MGRFDDFQGRQASEPILDDAEPDVGDRQPGIRRMTYRLLI